MLKKCSTYLIKFENPVYPFLIKIKNILIKCYFDFSGAQNLVRIDTITNIDEVCFPHTLKTNR